MGDVAFFFSGMGGIFLIIDGRWVHFLFVGGWGLVLQLFENYGWWDPDKNQFDGWWGLKFVLMGGGVFFFFF